MLLSSLRENDAHLQWRQHEQWPKVLKKKQMCGLLRLGAFNTYA